MRLRKTKTLVRLGWLASLSLCSGLASAVNITTPGELVISSDTSDWYTFNSGGNNSIVINPGVTLSSIGLLYAISVEAGTTLAIHNRGNLRELLLGISQPIENRGRISSLVNEGTIVSSFLSLINYNQIGSIINLGSMGPIGGG